MQFLHYALTCDEMATGLREIKGQLMRRASTLNIYIYICFGWLSPIHGSFPDFPSFFCVCLDGPNQFFQHVLMVLSIFSKDIPHFITCFHHFWGTKSHHRPFLSMSGTAELELTGTSTSGSSLAEKPPKYLADVMTGQDANVWGS